MLIHSRARRQWAPGWQSGLFTRGGSGKPALNAFLLPLAQAWRRRRAPSCGGVQPRTGAQTSPRISTGAAGAGSAARGARTVAASSPST